MKIKKTSWLLILVFPLMGISQEKGIQFEQNLSWQQVQAKAKQENKYIFAECYASWCGPCKQMDKTVYSVDSIGVIYNNSFVSFKVQCDTSKNDDSIVRAAYVDAYQIVTTYKITAYPTFLFFSPDGKLVHKDLG